MTQPTRDIRTRTTTLDTTRYSERVTDLNNRLNALRETLAACGSLVLEEYTAEEDQDVPPGKFTRNATFTYVFPPLDTELETDFKRPVDTTPGYSLTRHKREFRYNEARVTGQVVIKYNDDSPPPRMLISMIQESAPLPDEARAAVDAAFADLPVMNIETSAY